MQDKLVEEPQDINSQLVSGGRTPVHDHVVIVWAACSSCGFSCYRYQQTHPEQLELLAAPLGPPAFTH